MRREGLVEEEIEFVRRLDLRYVGQSYELTVPSGGDLAERFHTEHDRVYGFSAETEPIECVSLRLTTVGRIAKPPARSLARGDAAEPKARREVYFAEASGYVDCPIYDRYALAAGVQLAGPAVIEEFDSTTIVHPGYALRVDDQGNLIIEREA
jgi:N-methylhydantoinase A